MTTNDDNDPFAGLDDVEPANQTVTETVVSHTANVPEVQEATADDTTDAASYGAYQLNGQTDWIPGLPAIKRGGWFVYDLETVPDTTRFPKPEAKQPQDREPCGKASEELLGKAINLVVPWLSKMSVAELQQMLAWETAGKSRSTMLDKINAELSILTGTDTSGVDEWRKRSFDPFSCRIVALGIATREYVWRAVAKTPEEERELLRVFWMHCNENKRRIGYNITAFDDRVIVARSMLLKADSHGLGLDLGRYDKARIDLFTMLFGASRDSYKLKDLCEALGIVPEAGYEMRGDKVLDLVEADDWDGIAHYVQSDAKIERQLYEMLAEYTVV
jgi:hypothetical protein